jgi:hypothetical protein
MRTIAIAIAMTLAGCGTYDGGGSVYEYSTRYREMEQRGEMWVAPDFCGSACTLGLRNKNVCYRLDTVFAFHCVSSGGKCDKRASEAFKSVMPEGVGQKRPARSTARRLFQSLAATWPLSTGGFADDLLPLLQQHRMDSVPIS